MHHDKQSKQIISILHDKESCVKENETDCMNYNGKKSAFFPRQSAENEFESLKKQDGMTHIIARDCTQ